MIANAHVSWDNFITCLWNDVFQRTFRKWNAKSRKRDHEDFLLGYWKNETIKLQALLANHDFRPMKNIPIAEPLDYQQSECFGLFVFSFLLIGLFLLIKYISLFLFCSLEILETKSECTPRYDENWPMQDNPYLIWWNRELTMKCKLKCYLNPWITHRALALIKGNREPHEAKKKSFDLGGNRTHDLRIRSTVTLPTELRGRTEKVGDDLGWWIAAKRK